MIIAFQMSNAGDIFSQEVTQRVEPVDPKQLARFVVRGELAAADKESERLITYYRNLVAADPRRKNVWTGLHVFQVGYYMYARVQVLALKGDHENALKALEHAENYSGSHEEFSSALVTGWQEIVAVTRGLVFEKKGNRAEARKIYQHSLSDYARARLALMALEDADEDEARRLALQDITNPTAGFVLGQLEEKKKNITAAKEQYDKAWARLQKSMILGSDNEFLPIYFCEGAAITQALERLKE